MLKRFFSISHKIEGNIGYIILNNDKRRNPLNFKTLTQLNYQLDIFKESHIKKQKPRVVIISHEGNTFSSGLDIDEIRNNSEVKNLKLLNLTSEISSKINKMPYVSICQINGLCLASGLQFALSCDLVISDMNSLFGLPALRTGIFSFLPSIQLQQIMSQRKIMELILTQDFLNAQQALEYGIVNKISQGQKDMDQITQDYIFKILHSSPEIIAFGKQKFYNIIECNSQTEKYQMATEYTIQNFKKADTIEGMNAFEEKRIPNWKKK